MRLRARVVWGGAVACLVVSGCQTYGTDPLDPAVDGASSDASVGEESDTGADAVVGLDASEAGRPDVAPDARGADAALDTAMRDADVGAPIDRGLHGGEISRLVFDRARRGTVYAMPRTYDAYIQKSTDGGATWAPLTALAGIFDSDLLFDPTGSGRLLVFDGGREYRSDDGGLHFTTIPTDFRYAHAWSPTFPSTIYAVSAHGPCGATKSVLDRSDDEGATWKCVPSAEPIYGPLHVSPAAADVLFADGLSYESALVPLRRSSDGGKTWSVVFGPLHVSPGPTATSPIYGYTETTLFRSVDDGVTFTSMGTSFGGPVTVDEAAPDVLLVSLVDRLMRSTDGGVTWAETADPLPGVNTLAFDPNDANVVLAAVGYEGIFKSVDGGKHWADVSRTLNVLDVYQVETTRADANVLYAATARGLFVSRDRDTSWTWQSKERPQASDLMVAPSAAGVLYAHSYLGRLERSDDYGASWTTVFDVPPGGGDVFGLTVSPDDPQHVWWTTPTGLRATSDGGVTSSLVTLPPTLSNWGYYRLHATSSSHLVLVDAESGAIHVSSDGGVTWTKTRDAPVPFGGNYGDLGGVGHDVYVCDPAGLAKSSDDGVTWTRLRSARCESLEVAPSDPESIYVRNFDGGGVFRSVDGGATFTAITSPPVGGALVVDGADPRRLTAYGGAAMARSLDGGDRWVRE